MKPNSGVESRRTEILAGLFLAQTCLSARRLLWHPRSAAGDRGVLAEMGAELGSAFCDGDRVEYSLPGSGTR